MLGSKDPHWLYESHNLPKDGKICHNLYVLPAMTYGKGYGHLGISQHNGEGEFLLYQVW